MLLGKLSYFKRLTGKDLARYLRKDHEKKRKGKITRSAITLKMPQNVCIFLPYNIASRNANIDKMSK